jgi:hypothetical protein
MRWFAWVLSLHALAMPVPLAFGQDRVDPRDFWAGTKPVVWSLRAGSYSYSARQPSVSGGIPARQEMADTKPMVHAGRKRQMQAMSERATLPYRCWGTKPVVWSLKHGQC